ncbi:MAG: hypothetical protein LBG17_07370 [Bacteroidales bacterium]|jgi:hypothetical protein|nr:hypothetical protein [Bacteroidales bacterium]
MKKIIIMLLFSIIPLLPSSGQLPVTDIAHTSANVVGHAMSLTEAIEQGLSIVSQLSTLKQVYDQMKAVKETFDKVSNYIYNLQAIIDTMSRFIFMRQKLNLTTLGEAVQKVRTTPFLALFIRVPVRDVFKYSILRAFILLIEQPRGCGWWLFSTERHIPTECIFHCPDFPQMYTKYLILSPHKKAGTFCTFRLSFLLKVAR